MAKKKNFLGKKSKEIRRKTLEELQKKGIEIKNNEQISGGGIGIIQWLEAPPR